LAVEQTANIKFCLKFGKTVGEAFEMMKSVYGSDCLSRSKPRTSRTEDNVKKVTEILASDGRFSA
jgi:hypothetical protein